jgi:hypothetical protein
MKILLSGEMEWSLFQTFSNMPIPEELEKPERDTEYYYGS